MASVWGELKRRNVVKVAVAYAIVGWLLVEITSTVLPTFEAPQWVLQTITFVVILGFPHALILSWAYEITPGGIKLERDVADGESITHVTGRKLDFAIIGALVLALGFVVYNYESEDAPASNPEAVVAEVADMPPLVVEEQREVLPNSVAVLVCDNLSSDPNDAYVATSFHIEILRALRQIRGIKVIARTSVMQYANAPPPISQIAEELNVGAVMECSVLYAGDAILVTARLIDPETNTYLWEDAYPGDLSDLSTIFPMLADIGMNIADAVGAEFSLEEQARIEKIPTESPEAYAYYFRALEAWEAGSTNWDLFLDQAIELDPAFALAYARKAYLYTFNLVGLAGAGPDEATELERIVQFNAERALALDASLGIAQATLAVPAYVNWRGAEAEQAFQRALELSPNDVEVLVLYGRFKRYRGEFGEADQLLQKAVGLDPNNVGVLNQLTVNFRQSGNWTAAADLYRDLLIQAPTNITFYLGSALVEAALGNVSEAVRQLQIAEGLGPDAFRLSQLAHMYGVADQPEAAMRIFTELEQLASEDPVGDANWVRAYIGVGDYDGALQRLGSAIRNRSPTDLAALAGIAANPWGDPELEKPAFRALLDDLWLDK